MDSEYCKHGMSQLLKLACHRKNELVTSDAAQMSDEDIKWFETGYDRILEGGQTEYSTATDGE